MSQNSPSLTHMIRIRIKIYSYGEPTTPKFRLRTDRETAKVRHRVATQLKADHNVRNTIKKGDAPTLITKTDTHSKGDRGSIHKL